MDIATVTTTLRERAALAHELVKREQDERHEQEYRNQCDRLAGLAAKTFGVERSEIEFERRSESGDAVGKIEGMSFVVHAADFNWALQLISPCDKCGQERSATVYTLARLGELIADSKYFYHYCPPSETIQTLRKRG